MGRDLTNLHISESFQYLLQKSGSEVNDGLGADVDFLNISASYATSASVADTATSASHAVNADSALTATSASHAVNADSAISSSYAVTASFALNAGASTLQEVLDNSNEANADIILTGSYQRVSGSFSGSAIDNITDTYTGTEKIQHVITLTQAEYNALTPEADTFYVITDAEATLTTASISDATITFTKDDATTFDIEVNNVSSSISASHALQADSALAADTATSASYATTASYLEGGVDPFPYTGSADISGSLNLVGDGDIFGNLVVGNTSNTATGTYAVSLAGQNNSATGQYSAVIGGDSGTNSQLRSVIVGGESNDISGGQANVALAGINNHITNGNYNVVGGSNNTANGGNINIILGWSNTMTNGSAYFMNGRSNVVDSNNSEVGAIIGANSSRIGNSSNFLAQNFIGGGVSNQILGSDGSGRTINSAIIGGSSNLMGANGTGLGAGYSVIAGGVGNSISGSTYTTSSAVIAGNNNQALHNRSAVIAGEGLLTTQDDEVVVPNLTISGSGAVLTFADGTTQATAGGGGSAFPYTGSAEITGSLGVTGSFEVDGIAIGNGGSTFNTIIGNGANAGTGTYNTYIGELAGRVNTSGFENTLVGTRAGYDLTEGFTNNFYGALAGQNVTTGDENQIFGGNSLPNLQTGNQNIAIGHYTGQGITGDGNTIIGNRLNTGALTDSIVIGVGNGTKKWESTGGQTTIYDSLNVSGSLIVTGSVAMGIETFPTTNVNNGNVVIGGSGNGNSNNGPRITNGTAGIVLGGYNTTVSSTGNWNSILGGSGNQITGGGTNTIVGGYYNTLSSGEWGSIFGAKNSTISSTGANPRVIVGGDDNTISGTAADNAIIGGTGNTASHNRSVVIGGDTLSTTKADEVVVPNLLVKGNVIQDINTISITSNTGSLDASIGSLFQITLQNGTDTLLEIENQTAGQTLQLKIINNATAAGTISFDSQFEFEGGTAFTATAATRAVDILTLTTFDGTSVQCVGAKNFS